MPEQYEQKDNELVLFKNDRKETDRHADLSGQGLVAGKEYWISAWKNTSKAGKDYFKIRLQLKDSASEPNAKEKEEEVKDKLDLPF